jgi:hypothetical protein
MLPSVHSVGVVTVAVLLGLPAIGGLSVGAALASDCCQSSTLVSDAVLGDPDPGDDPDDPDFPFGDPQVGSADTAQTISQEVSQLVSQVLSEVLPQATGQQPAPTAQQQAPAVQQQAPAVQQQGPAVQQSSPPTQAGGATAGVGRRTQATGQLVSRPRSVVKRVVHRLHAASAVAVRPRDVTASVQRHQPTTEVNTRPAQPWRSASAAPTRRAVTASPAPLALLREPARLARWVAFVASACVLVVGVLLLAGARAKRRILKL